MAQISPARWNEMERIAAKDPTIRFRVIITLRKSASPRSLEDSGLRIEHWLKEDASVDIVSGSASIDVLKLLSVMNEVELVEEDGEVRAIHGSRP